jgi:hypothetical protein
MRSLLADRGNLIFKGGYLCPPNLYVYDSSLAGMETSALRRCLYCGNLVYGVCRGLPAHL